MNHTEFIKQNWKGLASKVRPRWLGLSDSDVAAIDGNYEVLIEMLREKYGYNRMQAEIEVDHFLEENGAVPDVNPV